MDDVRRARPLWHYAVMAAAVVLGMALVELAMGRVPVSKTGRLMLWAPRVDSAENSQQIFDWYSFSHVIHGMVFYGVFHLIGRRKWALGWRLVLAVCVEAAWEVFENTPFTIERYRKATIALDYYGDSVLNSVCDVGCCVAGFALAGWAPVWASVALVAAMELFVAYMIRDNLILNVVMLLRPVEAIKRWQSGG